MNVSRLQRALAISVTAAVLATVQPAGAAPVPVAGPAGISAPDHVVEAHRRKYRHSHRRAGVGAAAALGVLGLAAAAAAAARDRDYYGDRGYYRGNGGPYYGQGYYGRPYYARPNYGRGYYGRGFDGGDRRYGIGSYNNQLRDRQYRND